MNKYSRSTLIQFHVLFLVFYAFLNAANTEVIPSSDSRVDPEHFVLEIPLTGESSLIFIEGGEWLEPGWEIGLFDADGIVNSGNCDDIHDELLVGSAIWDGNPLPIVCIGSIDWCDIPTGFQLPGYIEGNQIQAKVWDPIAEIEYDLGGGVYSAGDGTWGSLITSLTLGAPGGISPPFIILEPFMNNLISIPFFLEDSEAEEVFGDDVFISWNDQGQYYVPSFNVDQIDDLENHSGYVVFSAHDEPFWLDFGNGMLPDLDQPIRLNPFMMNMIAYWPNHSMTSDDVLLPYADEILLASNDHGQYYIPEFGINSLSILEPGKGYNIFLDTNHSIDFYYPNPYLNRPDNHQTFQDYSLNTTVQTSYYQPQKTGLSQPIVIANHDLSLSAHDEIAVFDNDVLVGAAVVTNPDAPICIPVWQEFVMDDIYLPGYKSGNQFTLKWWQQSSDVEKTLEYDFNCASFDCAPLISGSVYDEIPIMYPSKFELFSPYPNPFNHGTKIEFRSAETGYIDLKVLNLRGELIDVILDGALCDVGNHFVNWYPVNQPSGVYFIQLTSNGQKHFQKSIYLK